MVEKEETEGAEQVLVADGNGGIQAEGLEEAARRARTKGRLREPDGVPGTRAPAATPSPTWREMPVRRAA